MEKNLECLIEKQIWNSQKLSGGIFFAVESKVFYIINFLTLCSIFLIVHH